MKNKNGKKKQRRRLKKKSFNQTNKKLFQEPIQEISPKLFLNHVINFVIMLSMTADQLTEVETRLGLEISPSQTEASANITKAIVKEGKARFVIHFAIKPPYPDPQNPDPYMDSVAIGKVYSYKPPVASVNPNA